ncbi:sigma-70 family RNA polymerase sigma factor [Gracilibacillus massiliensis]|uniref:sigma-70 family RNA polymerase sigma factor n=1 Tax=Gracilibacillus massiliensis TaxID=1564956 RepID=UPI00071DB78B|nr:sigma-70 family RNA polymerase sigma factor [Gracilibacillus massiliensis]
MTEQQKEELLEEIMIEHGDDLVRLAYQYVKDHETAKDMVQNTFIKCYQNLETFRYDASIKTWLYRITINQCKDYLKSWNYRKTSVREFMETAITTVLPSTEKQILKQAEKQEMRNHIFSLAPKYRELIFLYYYKSLTLEEIAEITEVNLNTVKTRLRRAKDQLKDVIEEANIYG